ncbi:hypothetical protein PTKIN_Ptkin02bG0240800 [Pterospermum kingtungense]
MKREVNNSNTESLSELLQFEMVRIFEVNLDDSHISMIRFYNGGSLRPNLSVKCGSDRLSFECKNEGGHQFCISGEDWTLFSRRRVRSTVTLTKDEDDDFYIINVRR